MNNIADNAAYIEDMEGRIGDCLVDWTINGVLRGVGDGGVLSRDVLLKNVESSKVLGPKYDSEANPFT
jgi:hypothetical protein